MNAPRILVVRTDRMGDVILSTPVLRALRQAFPNGYLGTMIRPEHRELVERHPDLDTLILYDKKGSERGFWGNLRFIRRLRSYRFDTAVILHSTDRVILLSWLAGIRRRIGYARRLGWGLTDRLPYVKRYGDRHEAQYNLDLLRFLGIESKEPALKVAVEPTRENRITEFLHQAGFNGDVSLMALHPGASCPSKRWPPDRFAFIADRLIDRYRAKIVVVTGPEEISTGQEVIRRMRHPAQAALGTFSLGELAWLLQKSRCLISNDSGPVHLASAVGTPVVAIFGRWGGGLSPTRWGPTGPNDLVLHHDVGCRPCLAHRCPIGFVCLKAVSVEEVLAAVEQVVGLRDSVESRSW